MSLYTILGIILAIIGIVTAIIGTGFFAIGQNYKESIGTLQSALQIHKDAGEAKDDKIADLSARITRMNQDLNTFKTHYNQLKKINLRLQRENLHWRGELSKIRKASGMTPITPYKEDSEDDNVDDDSLLDLDLTPTT